MKSVSIIFFWILSATITYAQDAYNSSNTIKQPKATSGFDPQRIVVGGNIQAGFGDGIFSGAISPMVGYQLTPNFMAGISAGVTYVSQKDANGFYNTTTNQYEYYPLRYLALAPGVWARYTIFNQFYFQAHFEEHFTSYNTWGPASVAGGSGKEKLSVKYNIPTLLLGVGYRAAISDRVGVFFGLSYDVLQKATIRTVTDSRGNPQTASSPYYGNIMPMIGFGFGF